MHRLYLFAFFIIFNLTANCQIDEDFNNTDLSAWSGDVGLFIVNTDGQLQLNNTEAGESTIYTTINFPDSLFWECDIRLQFSPSTNNNLTVLLATDGPDLSAANGYILKFGESGSNDAIELYQLIDGDEEIIGRGTDGKIATSFDIKIRLEKNEGDTWTLTCSDNTNPSSSLQFQINYPENQLDQFSVFGFHCKYSSSNASNFIFDNLKIQEITPDIEGPEVIQLNVNSPNEIEVIFNEPVEENTATNTSNYVIDNNTVLNVLYSSSNPDKVVLQLSNDLSSCADNTLNISRVTDFIGNVMASYSQELFIQETPSAGDLLINELLADPAPSQFDFVEIINPTQKSFSLKGLIIRNEFKDEERVIEQELMIEPGEVIAFTKGVTETRIFYNTPTDAQLEFLNLPSFNIADGNVSIIYESPLGGRIYLDSFDYFNTFHDPTVVPTKSISLERVSLIDDSNNATTWTSASLDIGASPGYANSNAEDPVKMITATIIENDQIEVKFLNGTNENSATTISNYSLDNGATIIDAESMDPDHRLIHLFLQSPLESGQVYNLTVDNIMSECGESIGTETITLFLLEQPTFGDILINELLFDGFEEPHDFVELINTTDKFLSLKEIFLFNNTRSDNPILITALPYLEPNQIVAFTEDREGVIEQYDPPSEANIVTQKVPVLNQSDGNISLSLLTANANISYDAFDYDESLHWQALSETKGVSLERIDTTVTIFSNDAAWNSSASVNNFATPGYKNSAAVNTLNISDEIISLESKVFSPDSDGFKDVLLINYNLDKAGYFGTITIFDDRGRKEIELINNQSFATSGFVKWDGTLNNNVIAPIGVYIVYYKFFHPDGDIFEGKKVCVLAEQL